jgi:hypothetical protein
MKHLVLTLTFIAAFASVGLAQDPYKNGPETGRGTGERTTSPYNRTAPPRTNGNFSASHLQATRDFFLLAGLNTLYDATVETELRNQIRQNPQLGPYADVMREFFRKYASWNAIQDDVARIYMSNFNEQEVRQLNAFAQTGAGRKLFRNLELFTRGTPTESQLRRLFTETEQKQLLAFSRTSLFQKFIDRTPVMAEQGATIGKQRVEEHQPELEQMIQRKARQLQQRNGN